MDKEAGEAYWQRNVRIVMGCMVVWFVVSYLFGIILVDALNSISLGGYPLGFWFAQQGSIFVFLGLTFYYAHAMNKLDEEFGVQED